MAVRKKPTANVVRVGQVPRASRVSLPCEFLGESLTGYDRDRAGLSHNRDWHVCNIGHGNVCPCGTFGRDPHGCNGCKDYVPSS
jgi:hypothetical protein